MPDKKQIGIIGSTGFTGSELVRLLYHHKDIEIAAITSERMAGHQFSDVHTQFEGLVDLELQSAENLDVSGLDLIFLALPHGVSMKYVEQFAGTKAPIIDLSGDFRLSNRQTYEKWYGKTHSYEAGFKASAYGIPELFRNEIRQSHLIANPGCYPTCSILGLAPLVGAGLIDTNRIIIDSKSGVTGAGISPKPTTHFTNVNDNFTAYGLKKHRHTVEIEETFTKLSGRDIQVQFTPHLLPVDRGILSTIYVEPIDQVSDDDLRTIYEEFYVHSPFVRLRTGIPSLKDVRGTNNCDIFITYDDRTNRIIVLSTIDNLMKGAAGQAVQNMNLLFGWEEQRGIDTLPLKP